VPQAALVAFAGGHIIFKFHRVMARQPAQGTDGMVDDNPPQPAPEGRITPVLVHALECSYESFLGHVLGQLPAFADSHGYRECLCVKLAVDLFTGTHIPTPGASECQLVKVYVKA